MKPPCSLHSLQFRSILAMLGRCIQVSTGTRGTYRATFLFWWGQMSFFCIQPLRLATKTTDIDSVHILFTDHKRSLWKCQVQITEVWNPLIALILALSTYCYSACIFMFVCLFFFPLYCCRMKFKTKKMSRKWKRCLEYCVHRNIHTKINICFNINKYHNPGDCKAATLFPPKISL